MILTGLSLGGLVTAAAIEEAHLGNVAGALTLCGPMAGSRNWDGALDIRLVYDAICGLVPGASIPGGAEGLPAGSSWTLPDNWAALAACFGNPALPGSQTPDQLARFARFLNVTKIPPISVERVMYYATLVMSDLVHSKLDGKLGTGNLGVAYNEDPLLDATIERVSPNPGAANRLERHYTPTGDVGERCSLSFVPPEPPRPALTNGGPCSSVRT